jgi:surfeit locus 1 family protein
VSSHARFLLVTVLALVGMAVTASLGLWQLDRAAQKEGLASAIAGRLAEPELDGLSLVAQGVVQPDAQALQHRRVRLRGQWLTQHSVWLDNRQMNGKPGLYLLTPLLLAGTDQAVMVQRGWVPRNFEDRTRVPEVLTSLEYVQLQGRIALSPSKLYELGQGQGGLIRQNIDLAAFSAEIKVPLAALTVLQTDASDAVLKRDWPVINAGVDKHHGYAFQWFGLCALIAILYVWFQIVRRQRQA